MSAVMYASARAIPVLLGRCGHPDRPDDSRSHPHAPEYGRRHAAPARRLHRRALTTSHHSSQSTDVCLPLRAQLTPAQRHAAPGEQWHMSTASWTNISVPDPLTPGAASSALELKSPTHAAES